MTKDKFDIEIGEQLRNAEAPIPEGAWSKIQENIQPGLDDTTSTQSFTFGLALLAGSALLISLLVYSSLKQEAYTFAEVSNPVEQSIQKQKIDSKLPGANIENQEREGLSNRGTQNLAPKEINTSKNSTKGVSRERVTPEAVGDSSASPVRVHNDLTYLRSSGKIEVTNNNTEQRDIYQAEPDEPDTESDYTHDSDEINSSDHAVVDASAQIKASSLQGYAPLTVRFENLGIGTCSWDFGTYAQSYTKAPEVTFEKAGIYTVYLTSTLENKSSAVDFVEIQVFEGSRFFAQDAFSPNGDGINDTYRIEGAYNISDFYMVITTETGDVVFQTKNLKDEWKFDGSGISGANPRFFLTYKAVGVDGKIYSENRKPIFILQ